MQPKVRDRASYRKTDSDNAPGGDAVGVGSPSKHVQANTAYADSLLVKSKRSTREWRTTLVSGDFWSPQSPFFRSQLNDDGCKLLTAPNDVEMDPLWK